MFCGGLIQFNSTPIFIMILSLIVIIPVEPYLSKYCNFLPCDLKESIVLNCSEGLPFIAGNLIQLYVL